jgi:hypothetical protein
VQQSINLLDQPASKPLLAAEPSQVLLGREQRLTDVGDDSEFTGRLLR